ncbi:MAG: 23S rRNA (guanosine-2'-O-)-methyltransferase RlmB [Syntrophus sp. SKADARSKE-3]|nr:23S rRNA (guanosine-2'-O-)-methyltransferase RlmB [Syntrophus sp. SKADARSKE-3]
MIRKPSKGQLKFWNKLGMAKYRQEESAFLAEGAKVVQELFRSPWEAAAVMVMEGRESRWEAILATLPYQVDIYILTEGEWRGITQDKEPEGIMAQVVLPEPQRTGAQEGAIDGHLLLTYAIRNPNNLGALFRTAHWFGVQTVMVSRDSVDITHPKVVRSSMGSLFHLNILDEMDFPALLTCLKDSHLIIGTDVACGIYPHPLPKPAALILGNESHGLPASIKAFAHECWRVPGNGGAESLSLPQAAAVMVYELTKPECGG